MATLGPEFIGKLPPGAQEDLQAELASCKELQKDRLIKGVEILGCADCPASQQHKGKVYKVKDVPPLPIAGCTRAPCCGCCYSAVT